MKPSKHKEITFPSEFVFVFISYFIEGILSKECCQKWGVWKKDKRVVDIGGLSIEGGEFKPSAHYYPSIFLRFDSHELPIP